MYFWASIVLPKARIYHRLHFIEVWANSRNRADQTIFGNYQILNFIHYTVTHSEVNFLIALTNSFL